MLMEASWCSLWSYITHILMDYVVVHVLIPSLLLCFSLLDFPSCRYNCGYNLGSCSCTYNCHNYGNCCPDYDSEFLLIRHFRMKSCKHKYKSFEHMDHCIFCSVKNLALLFFLLQFYLLSLHRPLLNNYNWRDSYNRCCCCHSFNLSDIKIYIQRQKLFQLYSSNKMYTLISKGLYNV